MIAPPLPAPGYEIEAESFIPAPDQSGGLIGFTRLLVTPPGLLLIDLRLVVTPRGLRICFPFRAVLAEGRPKFHTDGEMVRMRAGRFPDADDWERFSSVAVAAIARAFPGALDTVPSLPTNRASTAPSAVPATSHTPAPAMPPSTPQQAAA